MRAALARGLLAAMAGVYALAVAGEAGATNPQPPATTEGRLATRDGKQVVDVPLEHTEVKIRADGHIAEVVVEQTIRNPYDKKIEAVYLFPLPTGAAVNDMEIQVGARVVKGEILKREDVFVVDTSSSMRGAPLAKARELVRKMLTTLGPDDTFQIVRFADAASALGARVEGAAKQPAAKPAAAKRPVKRVRRAA
jgi:Ca-activated chloride channel family protein